MYVLSFGVEVRVSDWLIEGAELVKSNTLR